MWTADSRWNEIMSNENITKEEITAIFPKVAEIMADALGCDLEKVKPDSSLINDLGAESIDFLDIVFRLERGFKVKIPRGKIIEDARGSLSEVPAGRFPTPLKVAEIPKLFTTETFCKMVIRQQRATAPA